MWTFQLGVCHFKREGLGHEMRCRGCIIHTHFTLLSGVLWSEKPYGPWHSRDRANRRCSCGWHKGFAVSCSCKREDTTHDDVQSGQCSDQHHTQYKFIIIKLHEIHIIVLLSPATVGSTTGVFTATSPQTGETPCSAVSECLYLWGEVVKSLQSFIFVLRQGLVQNPGWLGTC